MHPLPVAQRRLLYLQQRVVDQITWYTSNASIWFWTNVGARWIAPHFTEVFAAVAVVVTA
ncbi:MAG: hypothetical protein NVS4B2_35620 [Chloroflexota bacterium]